MGANIFRGHTNVQGATDLGLDIVTLPLYYGLSTGMAALEPRLGSRLDWLKCRFDDPKLDEHAGHSLDALA